MASGELQCSDEQNKLLPGQRGTLHFLFCPLQSIVACMDSVLVSECVTITGTDWVQCKLNIVCNHLLLKGTLAARSGFCQK